MTAAPPNPQHCLSEERDEMVNTSTTAFNTPDIGILLFFFRLQFLLTGKSSRSFSVKNPISLSVFIYAAAIGR
jgi:hypothetical protein